MKILLVKVPTYPYPRLFKPRDFAEKLQVNSTASLALAILKGFVAQEFKHPHEMIVHDLNVHALDFTGDVDAIGEAALADGKRLIDESDFDVFAVSAQFMYNQPYCNDLIAWARARNPKALIVEGGGFATIFPEKTLLTTAADYAVIGEGEHTFVHILNRFAGIKDEAFERDWAFEGYVERGEDGQPRLVPKSHFVPDLARLATPDWDFPSAWEYMRRDPGAYLPFMASRGCPMGCTFCSTHLYWGKPVRYRPIAHVIDELVSLSERTGIRNFHCVDDNVSFDKKWFVDFCHTLAAEWPDPLSVTFSNFDIRHLTEEIVLALKAIGLDDIAVATESGDPEIQRMIHKKLNLERVQRTVEMLHQHGFTIHNLLMVGFPYETLEQIHRTIDFARKLRTESVQIFRTFPFPGTKVYEEGKALGVVDLDEDDFASLNYQRGSINTKEWTTEQVRQIAYDGSLELNFLNTPYYDTEASRDRFRARIANLIHRLPGHVILSIVAGYMDVTWYADPESRDRHFVQALADLKGPDPTFRRHMKWEFPQILAFKDWVRERHPGDYGEFFS